MLIRYLRKQTSFSRQRSWNSSHETPCNPVIKLSTWWRLHLTSRRILVTKILIAFTLDEGVHPRKLRFLLAELPIEICVRIAVNTVLWRSVCLSLIGVVESINGQYS